MTLRQIIQAAGKVATPQPGDRIILEVYRTSVTTDTSVVTYLPHTGWVRQDIVTGPGVKEIVLRGITSEDLREALLREAERLDLRCAA